jgi:Protein of unknown function
MRLNQYPSEQAAGRPLRQRPTRSKLIVRMITIGLLVLVIAFLGAALLVLTGPTEFGIVRERIASIIRTNLGEGYAVDIRRAVIDLDPVMGLVVRVDDLDVRDAGKQIVAHIPSTRFAIDPYSLLTFRVEVKQVELSGPEISFARGDGGSIFLGNAGTAAPERKPATPTLSTAEVDAADGGFPDLLAALYLMDRGIEPQLEGAINAGFERFAVVNGTISVWDAARQQQRRFPGTDLNVALDKTTSALSVTLATSGFGGRWTATIDRDTDTSSGSHVMSAVFSQLTIADILPALGDDDSLLTADIPLYGRANIRFAKDGSVEDADARLDFGAGVIRFGEERETVLLDEATVKVHWDVANRSLILDPSTFYFGETRGVVTGRVFPQGDPADRRYAFELESPGAVLAPRDSNERPIIAQRIAISGVADLKAKLLNVENAVIQAQDAAIAAAGSLGFNGVTPSLAMAATFSPMTVGTLKQMWIPMIATGARKWVMQHVSAGRLVSGRFEAAIPAGVLWTGKRPRLPDDALRLNMQVADVAFTTFGKLPPIVNASGNIVVSGSTVGIDLEKGEVKVPSGTVSVVNGAFAVPNTSKRPADGLIEAQFSGSAAALGEIADSDPINALSRRKLSPGDLSGTASANVSVRLPIRDGITDADVDWKVVVNTDDVASKKPVEGRSVSQANVALTVTPDEVAVYGKARIDGVGADVSMSFPIGAAATEGGPSDRHVRLLLDEEARKRFGVGLDEVLSGTLSALVSDSPDGKGQHYDLDLRRARVILPGIGWTKGIGVPATLTFDVKPANAGYAVENLVLEGDGFGFSGSARLDESYNLQSADITRLSLHAGDDISLKLSRGKNGYAITARGESFDLRGMMGHIRDKNDQAGGFPDIAVDARISRLVGFNQEEVTNASLTMVSVGGETQKISFSGQLGGDDISLNFAVAPDGTTLQANAQDAGRLMRFTDIYTRLNGGVVTISGKADRSGPLLGTLEVAGFDVVNEPAMEKVIAKDLTKATNGSAAIDPGHVHFERMVARFRKSEHVLAIEDALLSGASVGATFSGRYDLSTTAIDITGTYLPAYAFNNLFSRIPILGIALGGGSREGLFGVTFKIAGPIAQPQVYFNPLSAVAPGIFRKIFEFQRPTQ